MRVLKLAAVGLLVIGLVVTSIGWYLSAPISSSEKFDSCRIEDGQLVLVYGFGANQLVEPAYDARGSDFVVSLTLTTGDGVTPAIGLTGEARFHLFGEPDAIRYPDGEELDCEGL